MTEEYSEITKQHIAQPQNQLTGMEPFEFDGRGIWADDRSDDQLVIYLVVKHSDESINDCRWQLFGLPEATAGCSVLSELVKGLTLEKAFQLSAYQLIKKLGGFPDRHIGVITTVITCLKLAINNYYAENGLEHKTSDDFALKICKCMDVTDKQIEAAVKSGAETFEKVQAVTQCSTGCGTCAEKVQALISDYQTS